MGYVGATLTKQSIHEGGLAMVNMRDHSHIAKTARVEGAVRFSGGGRGGGWNSAEGAWGGAGNREYATWGESG